MGFIKLSAVLCAWLIALIVVESKVCKKAIDFDRHPGIKLQGHVIKKMTTSDLMNCVTECGKTQGCLSINSHNDGNTIHCELNKSNRFGSQVNLKYTSLDNEYLEMVYNPDWPDACFQKDGWYRNQSAVYKFVDELVAALEARKRCQQISAGADLVSFVDKEEEETFDQYLRGIDKAYGKFWIGFNDLAEEGTFVWFDGTKSRYTNWYQTEPNNQGNEDCTYKDYDKVYGGWHDRDCDAKYRFACKVLCK